MKLYKLTETVMHRGKPHYTTRNDTVWGPGVTHRIENRKVDPHMKLCSTSWLHAYDSPLCAALLNQMHVGFDNPTLWLAEGGSEGHIKQEADKIGVTTLTTIKKIGMPRFTTKQLLEIEIRVCIATLWQFVKNVDHAKIAIHITKARRPMGSIPRKLASYIRRTRLSLAAKESRELDYALSRIYACDATERPTRGDWVPDREHAFSSAGSACYHLGRDHKLKLHEIIEGVKKGRPFNGQE